MNHCQSLTCKQAKLKEDQAQRQKQLKEQQAQLTYHIEQFRALQAQKLRTPTSQIATIQTPYNDRESIPLSEDRKQRFIAHLQHLVATLDQANQEVDFTPEQETPRTPHLDKIVTQSCHTCRGHCCLQGGDYNAFIQRRTLVRVLESHDEIDSDTIVDHYQQFIPDQAMESGCIYQTNTGCNLPPKMRASICHTFFCRALHLFITENQRDKKPFHLIVASDKASPQAGCIVSEQEETQPVNPKELSSSR